MSLLYQGFLCTIVTILLSTFHHQRKILRLHFELTTPAVKMQNEAVIFLQHVSRHNSAIAVTIVDPNVLKQRKRTNAIRLGVVAQRLKC